MCVCADVDQSEARETEPADRAKNGNRKGQRTSAPCDVPASTGRRPAPQHRSPPTDVDSDADADAAALHFATVFLAPRSRLIGRFRLFRRLLIGRGGQLGGEENKKRALLIGCLGRPRKPLIGSSSTPPSILPSRLFFFFFLFF